MSRSKDKGTAWESTIVAYLREQGFPHVERRALLGVNDRGDISGLPDWVIEAKNCRREELPGWLDEAEAERVNAGAEYGVVWHHRRGRAHPRDGFVTMSGATYVRLLRAVGGR